MRLNSQFRSLLGAFRRTAAWLRREDGISLLMVMGFVIIFSITTSAIVSEVTSNEKSAGRDDSSVTLFNLAEAALNFGADSTIDWANTNDLAGTLSDRCLPATSPCAPPPWTSLQQTSWPSLPPDQLPQWYAQKVTDPLTAAIAWTVHARATRGLTTKELEIRLTRHYVPAPDAFTAWKGAFANNKAGRDYCVRLDNNITISQNLFTSGDLCIPNSAAIFDDPKVSGPNTTVYVGNDLWIDNQGTIGTSSEKILHATVRNKCHYNSADVNCKTAASSKIYASDPVVTGGPAIEVTKPPLDLSWYENASPGPKHPCVTQTGTPPTFDNDSTRNKSLGQANLFPSTAYSCTTPSGSISWTPGSPGHLVVSGAIYFDGDFSPGGDAWVQYSGSATIYFTGTVNFANYDKICPTAACTPNPDFTSGNMLVLVAMNNGVTPGWNTYTFQLSNSSIFQGGAYAVGGWQASNTARMEGPVVADAFRLSNQAQFYAPLNIDLPDDAPSEKDTILAAEQGSWRQIK